MFYLFLDTCVWIALTKRADLRVPLDSLECLVAQDAVTLLKTAETQTEYTQGLPKPIHQARTEREILLSLAGRMKQSTDKKTKELSFTISKEIIKYVDNEAIAEASAHVTDLLARCEIIPETAVIRERVYNRIKSKKSPCHNIDKSVQTSINDVIIFESFVEAAANAKADDHFIFVTTNHRDFSEPSKFDDPHDDIKGFFTSNVQFTNNIVEAIAFIQQESLLDSKWSDLEKLRRQSWNEIRDHMLLLETLAWYHEHLDRKKKTEDGQIVLTPGYDVTACLRPRKFGLNSWRQELAKADELVLQASGLPRDSDPYEAGFVGGAITALEWVLGNGHAPGTGPTRFPSTTSPIQQAKRVSQQSCPQIPDADSVHVPSCRAVDSDNEQEGVTDRPRPPRGLRSLQKHSDDEENAQMLP